jgi:hypothetical protein
VAGALVTRRAVAIVLDICMLGLGVLALSISSTGGFILTAGGLVVRFRTPTRALLWLAVALVVRLAVSRRTPLFGVRWRALVSPPETPGGFQDRAPARSWWRPTMLASLAIALAVGIVLHDQVANPYSVPDAGDPLFSMWRMGWVNHQIVSDPAHLFDANIFYPERLTLALSDPIILPALMGAPLAAVGIHPVVAYNVLLFTGFWLSGIAAYLLVERLTASPPAAFAAGLMFACYSYRFDHYSHLELQMTQWIPLGLIALHLLVVTGRWPYAVALALAGVAQLYSSMYYGVLFLIYAAVVGIGLLVVHRPAIPRLLRAATVGAALAAALSVPLVRPFIAAQAATGERTIDEVTEFSARPSDYLRAHKHSAIWRERILPAAPERALFPGAAPLLLAAVALVPPLSPMRIVYAAAGLVAYDASLGFGGYTYPQLHAWLVPIRGLRSPARFSVFVGLTLCVLGGFGVRRILQRWPGRTTQPALLMLVTALIVVDAWPALTLIPVWRTPPAVYQSLPPTGSVVLAELPVLDSPVFNPPFMYFSLWHWRPMVNGYSGHIPASYDELTPALQNFPRGTTPAELRARGVTHVVVNCGLRYAVPCEETRLLMRKSPDLRMVREARWENEQVELYELKR